MDIPELTPEDLLVIKGHVDGIRQLLDEKGITKNLTKTEVGNLNIIGNKRKPAAQKALEIATLKPEILPPAFSLPDYEAKMNLITAIEGKVSYALLSLLEVVEESRFWYSDTAWDDSLKTKQYLETANRTDAGLDELLRELNEHFTRASGDEDDTDPQPPEGE